MRKSICMLAALTAGAGATPALAQEDGRFTGVRVEGLVGYDTTDVEGENSDGVAYGIGLGYDMRSGGALFGIEGEVSESTVDECVTDVDVAGDRLCASAGRDLYAGGRVGGLVGRNLLVYGKAGYTNARVNLDYTTGVVGTEVRSSENLDGVRVGGGLELGLGPNAFAKTEYRYSNYEQGFDRHQVVAGFGFRF